MSERAIRHASSSLVPNDEIARLHGLGFSLVPLGRGEDGKSPIVAYSGKPKFGLGQVLGPMHGRNSGCYGIRLEGLLVVDCDEYNKDLIIVLEARFGASPVHVRTPRGIHLYYKGDGRRPNLRAEGLPVDIKSGPNSYVVGPLSVRPDGEEYLAWKGTLGECPLPELIRPCTSRPTIKVGARNHALTKAAMEMVRLVDSLDELTGNLYYLRDEQTEMPETVPDAEIDGIAQWAWKKRLDNRIYAGRNSSFALDRTALDVLKSVPKSTDAIALYAVLTDLHGHRPEKPFALVWSGMKASGHIDLSKRRFTSARRLLQRAGIVEIASRAATGTRHQTFRFARIHPGQMSSPVPRVPKE